MTKWKYMIYETGNKSYEETLADLNQLGEQGWELVFEDSYLNYVLKIKIED